MKSSINKALLFVIALSTSIMTVQLIPISRKAYLYNLCRDFVVSQEQAYELIRRDEGGENRPILLQCIECFGPESRLHHNTDIQRPWDP